MLNKQNIFGTNTSNDRYRRDTLNTAGSNATVTPASPSSSAASANPAAEAAARPTPAAENKTVPTAEEAKGSRLTVGPDIKLRGAEITDCDTLVVEGRVEASMDSRVIQIAERGSFHGNVGIDVADIRGEFHGELTARKQLIIRATGSVSGTIRYGKLVIEEGGELAGDIASIASSTASSIASSPGKPAATASSSGKSSTLQPAGTH